MSPEPANKVNTRSSRVKESQRRPLFAAVAARPKLICNTKLSARFTSKDCEALWKEVANEVNSGCWGPKKSSDQWQKTWNDLRRAVRKKHAEIQQSLHRPDGRPLDCKRLTALEEEILEALSGNTANEKEDFLSLQTISEELNAYPKNDYFHGKVAMTTETVRKASARSSRIKDSQRRPLYEAVASRPKLLNAKFSAEFTSNDSDALWWEVANEVNAGGWGPNKSPEQWQKSWNDMRRAVKRRQAEIQACLNGTSDGTLDYRPLTNLEEAILATMSSHVENGDTDVFVQQINIGQEVATSAEPVEKINVRRTRLKEPQRRPLFEAVAVRPRLLCTKFSAEFTSKDSEALWQEVANEVNAGGLGPNKSAEQWQKTWNDLRRAVKKKYAEIQLSLQQAGERPSNCKPLTELEEAILALVSGTTENGAGDFQDQQEVTALEADPLQQEIEGYIELVVINDQPDQLERQPAEHPVDRLTRQMAGRSDGPAPETQPEKILQAVLLASLQKPSSTSSSPVPKVKRKLPTSPSSKAILDLGSYRRQLLDIKRQTLAAKTAFYTEKLAIGRRKAAALELLAASVQKHFSGD